MPSNNITEPSLPFLPSFVFFFFSSLDDKFSRDKNSASGDDLTTLNGGETLKYQFS